MCKHCNVLIYINETQTSGDSHLIQLVTVADLYFQHTNQKGLRMHDIPCFIRNMVQTF